METDWNTATFTMNWRILTPGVEVSFEKGEPICFIQPVDIGLIESMVPEIQSLASSPETEEKRCQEKRCHAECSHPVLKSLTFNRKLGHARCLFCRAMT